MPSNYSANGVDLDDKFMPLGFGGAGATNYSVSGTDLNARYHPRGSTAKIADVGYQTGGSDISNTFMEKHDCIEYQTYYDINGEAIYEWTNCYGGTTFQDEYYGNDGEAAFETGCAWRDTLLMYSLSAINSTEVGGC